MCWAVELLSPSLSCRCNDLPDENERIFFCCFYLAGVGARCCVAKKPGGGCWVARCVGCLTVARMKISLSFFLFVGGLVLFVSSLIPFAFLLSHVSLCGWLCVLFDQIRLLLCFSVLPLPLLLLLRILYITTAFY